MSGTSGTSTTNVATHTPVQIGRFSIQIQTKNIKIEAFPFLNLPNDQPTNQPIYKIPNLKP
ncbi:hypothetical protein C1H46_016112 [Malus baccata]|uniref:Uncharacterized protein n=1 Tax=Malus baccata TaxID=106549 RepID=A0A540MHR8_MALBA|nr:hypothetical protein C1H46_016112 [Malus baccata]